MKKVMIFGMTAVLAVGTAMAQDDMVMVGQSESDVSEVLVTVEAALVSSHVWRGQVQNNDFVFQPQVTIEQYGVSLNIWANYDMGKSFNGTQSDVSEIDFSLAYTLPIDFDQMTFDVGLVNYHFMGNGDVGTASPSTTEIFARATVQSWKDYVIPSVVIFGDIDKADGVYALFDIVAPYQISDPLYAEVGISAGWGNTSYNDYYWGTLANGFSQDEGWNDYNFYGNVSYEITGNLTTAFNLTYTMVEGGAIGDAADRKYEADEKVYFGLSIAYDF